MKVAERHLEQVAATDNVSIITNAALITRRIRELQRRRQNLLARQEHLRTQLPDWAVEPLKLVGMTGDEVRGLVDDLSSAEAETGLDDVEQEMNEIDQQAEALENLLINTPSASIDELSTVMDLVVKRFREIFVTDPGDVFYDHGEARLLAMIERVHGDLSQLNQTHHQHAG